MATRSFQQTLVQQGPIRYLPAEAYQAIPREMIKDRVSLWSRCQQIDTEGRLFKVVAAQDGKVSVAVSHELNCDFEEVKQHFERFQQFQTAWRLLNSQFLLEPQQTFLDQAVSPDRKLRLWTVYESCPYFLAQGTDGKGIKLPSQNVILEIEMRHFLTALLELVWLFRNALTLDLLPNLKDYAIGIKNGEIKLLLTGTLRLSPAKRTPPVHPIFEEEQPFGFDNRKGINKLDLIKDSHHTAESLETDGPEVPNLSNSPRLSPIASPSNGANRERPPETTKSGQTDHKRFLLQFAVSVCYELFKGSLLHSRQIPAGDRTAVKTAIEEAKKGQFKDLFATFDFVYSAAFSKGKVSISQLLSDLQSRLQNAPHRFVTFKNDSIRLMKKPVYSSLRQIRLEISDSTADCDRCVKAVVEALNERQFSVIELLFQNKSLTVEQMASVAESMQRQTGVRHLSLGWPNCPTDAVCIDRVCRLLQSSTPSFVSLNLNGTQLTPTELEYLVNALAALPPNTLQGFELSLCALKREPIALADSQLAQFMERQTRLQTLRLELTSVAFDAQLSASVAECIGEMTDLTSVDVRLGGEAARSTDFGLLAFSLSRLTSLKSLSLHLLG